MSSKTMECLMIMRYFANQSHANTTNLPLVDVPDDEYFQNTTQVQRFRSLDISTTASMDASMMLKRTIELVNRYDVSVPSVLRERINLHFLGAGDDVDDLTEQSRKRPLLENDLFSDYDELSESDEVFSDSTNWDASQYKDWDADRPRTPNDDEKSLVYSCSTPTLIEQTSRKFPDRSATPSAASASPRRGQKSDRGSHVPNHKDRYNFRSISEWMVVSVLILVMVAYNEHITFSAEWMTTAASLNPCGRGIDDIRICAVSLISRVRALS